MKSVIKIFVVLLAFLGFLFGNTAFANHQSFDPNRGLPGQNITSRVTSSGTPAFTSPFEPSDVTFTPGTGITVTGANFVSGQEVHITFEIARDAPSAVHGVKIQEHDNAGAFTVADVPGEQPTERRPRTVATAQTFIDLLENIVDWVFVVVLIGAVVFIVLAGWQFISGGGEPQAVAQARTKLLWAAVGIGIAVLSRGIIAAIRNIIGS